MDTICALSSGAPPSGVAVIRISGDRARACVEQMCGPVGEPREAVLRTICDPESREPYDEGFVLWMPGPASYTGEDCAELQCHGSRAVVQAIILALTALEGVRLAEPGEFSRRAFDHGKLDLTELEGLADLIQAETEVQRRQAFQLAQGHMRRDLEAWRGRLIDLRAQVEARLDFSDEDDVSVDLPDGFFSNLDALQREIATAAGTLEIAERVRDGFRVAIMGAPNAGKSTLLNRIARRDVAIVTEEAGTTRDILQVPLDLNGYPVVLFDTAGLRQTENVVEREGIRRAKLAAEQSDLVLWLKDVSALADPAGISIDSVPVWTVWTKSDLSETPGTLDDEIRISALTGRGIDRLMDRLSAAASQAMTSDTQWLVTRGRQAACLQSSLSALADAHGDRVRPLEMIAEDLRRASDGIGRATGRIDVEEVLDRLFGEFCIGK